MEGLSQNLYEPNYFGIVFGLLVVVALIYITGIIYKKLITIKLDKNSSFSNIQIVTSQSLGQNKNLYIIKINKKYCLIGATANSIAHIKDLDSEDVEIEIKEDKNAQTLK